MVMWRFEPAQRVPKLVAEKLPREKLCLWCGGPLARVAERELKYPYAWIPNGWICTKCNFMYMGVN